MNPLTESATNSSAALSKNTALSGYAKDQPFVLSNLQLASCSANPAMPDNEAWSDYGLIEAAAIAIEDGKIAWCGAAAELPSHYKELPVENCGGRLATPSLIDCHTHIVHGGSRAREFEQRLGGVSYAEISASGGGIVSTVNATRSCSVDELVELALPRIDTLLNEGVCVLEIKSGYGLDQNTELNMLRAARKIETLRPVTVKTSFLGAHALPAEFKGSDYQGREQDATDTYIDTICLPALEQAHTENLVDAVDGFCEHIAFSVAQIERVFKKARNLNLPVKLHAEQLSLLGGTELAASFQALSADHLEYLDEAGVKAMAESSTVAVLLPGAFYTLREKSLPPLEHFRQHKVPIAIATDSNPGSSPLTSLLLAMNMSCTLFSMTPAEALNGVTRNAARALGLKEYGSIEQGKCADLCLWDVQAPAELSYRIGFNPLHKRLYPITPSSTTEAQS